VYYVSIVTSFWFWCFEGRKRGMRFMEVECKSFADMGFCRVLGLRR
jgi:hypothetical protein